MPKRRQVMRLGIPIRVVYRTDTGEQGVMNSRDVSREGLHFFAGRSLAAGTALHLELFLPWEVQPIRATGRVAWMAPAGDRYEGGLTFTDITDTDRERIQSSYVKSQGPF